MLHIEGYEILDEIGRGGAGTVYLARQTSLGRLVAIKALVGRDAEQSHRLVAEARVLAGLDDPHVVSVVDVGETDGRPWYTMVYYGGGTLADVLDRDRELSVGQVVTAGVAVARGLATLHELGIVHRDVKPGNVLLSDRGNVVLGDLGTAVDGRAERVTTTGAVLGTLGYTAPELIEGGEPTAACDVFSMGVVLYELLAGSRPFRGAHIAAVLEAVRTGEHVSLDEAVPGIPAGLAELIEATLVVSPEQRPRDLRTWANQLADAVPAEPLVPVLSRGVEDALTTTVGAIRSRPLSDLTPHAGDAKSRRLVSAVAVAALLGVLGAVVWAVAIRSDSSQTSIVLPSQSLGADVNVTTTWTVDADTVAGTSEITNDSGDSVELGFDEVVPKRLVGHVDQITFRPAPDAVVEADPIVRFCLTVPANSSVTLSWTATDTEATAGELDEIAAQWKEDFSQPSAEEQAETCSFGTTPTTTTTTSTTSTSTSSTSTSSTSTSTSTTSTPSSTVAVTDPVASPTTTEPTNGGGGTTATTRPPPSPTTATTAAPTTTTRPATTTTAPPPPPLETDPPTPTTAVVPNVIGDDYSAGAQRVRNEGFVVQRVVVTCDDRPSSQIDNYSPKGEQARGSTVQIFVCQ